MKIKHLLFACICCISISLSAQDMQYSYYQFSPISYNPAFTGAFYGNLRINGMFRDQLRTIAPYYNDVDPRESLSGTEYRTTSLSLDGNIPFGFKDGDWVSAGINLVKDKSGASGYRHDFNGFSVAYHMTLGKKQNTVLTFGGKYGSYTKGIGKPSEGQYYSLFLLSNPGASDNDIDNIPVDPQGVSTNDFMLGVLLSAPLGDNSDLRVGIASDHLFAPRLRSKTPTDTTITNPPNQVITKLERRINVVAQYYVDLNDNITFNPSIVYQKMGAASNILIQSLFSYHMPNNDDLALNFGLGFRMADNAVLPFYMGADFNDWRIGMSYGINMSGLSASGREGGFELGIARVFSWNKKAKVKPIFVCPRL